MIFTIIHVLLYCSFTSKKTITDIRFSIFVVSLHREQHDDKHFIYLFECSFDCSYLSWVCAAIETLKMNLNIANPHSLVSSKFHCCSTTFYFALTSHSHRQCFDISKKKITFLCIINNFDNTNQFVCRTKYLDKCKRKYFMLHGSFACTLDELVWGIGWRIVSGNSSVCMKEELQEKRCVVWNSFVIVIFYVLPRAKFTLHIFSKSIRFLKPSNIFIIFFSLFYIIHSLRTLCFAFLKTLNLLFKQGVVKFLSEYNYMQSTSFLSIMMKNIIFLGIIFFFTFYLECFLQQFSIVLYKHYILLLFVKRDSQRLNIIFIL